MDGVIIIIIILIRHVQGGGGAIVVVFFSEVEGGLGPLIFVLEEFEVGLEGEFDLRKRGLVGRGRE